MKANAAVVIIALALVFSAGAANAQGATAPYNEAVRIVDGKRVVEMPPVPAHFKRPDAFFSKPDEKRVDGNRNTIETPEGLMDCRGMYAYHPRACVPSNYGKVVQAREWVVKKDGRWQACVGRTKPIQCKDVTALAFLPTVRE
jgi:hypothetical protein